MSQANPERKISSKMPGYLLVVSLVILLFILSIFSILGYKTRVADRLVAGFGALWQSYYNRVLMWIPRLGRRKSHDQ